MASMILRTEGKVLALAADTARVVSATKNSFSLLEILLSTYSDVFPATFFPLLRLTLLEVVVLERKKGPHVLVLWLVLEPSVEPWWMTLAICRSR